MTAYLLRRLLYAVPILIGVNLLTFALFFVVNSPDDMARLHLGNKHVTADAIATWKRAHGYDRPLLYAPQSNGLGRFTDTLFSRSRRACWCSISATPTTAATSAATSASAWGRAWPSPCRG